MRKTTAGPGRQAGRNPGDDGREKGVSPVPGASHPTCSTLLYAGARDVTGQGPQDVTEDPNPSLLWEGTDGVRGDFTFHREQSPRRCKAGDLHNLEA